MSETPYTPIDCGFHDLLESHAVRGLPCEIAFQADAGAITLTARILDVYSRGGEEFIRLDALEMPIRLDRLVRVAGVERPGYCAPAP